MIFIISDTDSKIKYIQNNINTPICKTILEKITSLKSSDDIDKYLAFAFKVYGEAEFILDKVRQLLPNTTHVYCKFNKDVNLIKLTNINREDLSNKSTLTKIIKLIDNHSNVELTHLEISLKSAHKFFITNVYAEALKSYQDCNIVVDLKDNLNDVKYTAIATLIILNKYREGMIEFINFDEVQSKVFKSNIRKKMIELGCLKLNIDDVINNL